MTVAMTQGSLNAQHPKTLKAWQSQRERRRPTRARASQSKAQFTRAIAQLQAAFPDNVKVH